jgi:hypothetical protein
MIFEPTGGASRTFTAANSETVQTERWWGENTGGQMKGEVMTGEMKRRSVRCKRHGIA